MPVVDGLLGGVTDLTAVQVPLVGNILERADKPGDVVVEEKEVEVAGKHGSDEGVAHEVDHAV